jgi:tripeptide aminopeptidase
VLERLLRYARIDTQAAYRAPHRPSTETQLELSRLLVDELLELGLEDARLTEDSNVFASLPGASGVPVVGLIAHVDTTPDVTAEGVSPIVHRAWGGDPIELPGDGRQVLDPQRLPELAARVGHDIVTSDGTTLLGADDKAGIAEIMAAVAHLVRHPELARAPIRVAFTVDEEVGRGAEDFDLEAFGADVAYTLDGSGLGELEIETFSAKAIRVTIRGLSVHPGTAKGKLVNAVKLAAQLVESLPPDRLSPETTAEREGYVHPHRISGNAEQAIVDFIARDHDDALLEEHVELLRSLVARVAEREPRADLQVEVRDSYRNMRPYIEKSPRVVEAALEAIRRAGVEPRTIQPAISAEVIRVRVPRVLMCPRPAVAVSSVDT